jgi:hypothetical protein
MARMRSILVRLLAAPLLVAMALVAAPAHAVDAAALAVVAKTPWSYSLKEYGFVLGMALLGGVVEWYAKVRRGELNAGNITALVGELTTAALAGLLAFFVCEWLSVNPMLAAAVVGISGHMGARALALAEAALQSRVRRGAGMPPTEPPAPPPAA